ncbi:MupA/Atu3671 family FMN-dependent luciferase-like monooxygenase [Nocardia altamirensis]|uniref:MupA/Atu3671 family FMN-dependent luciferase-like monooxygenase n=1 Tax=Nocardia altamirensis TaxID=472158 RepID=UPI00083FDC2D|nr:MupA/Atu3671 family FMN-dependent luciferase-like monooxygenase [Nocardia altamirensis]
MTEDISTGDRRELLASMLQHNGSGRPLSYPQQRLWFLDQLDPDSAVYNMPLGYLITGPLEVEPLRRALSEVVRRHEVLRTVFLADQGRPWQLVLDAVSVDVPVVDLTGDPDPEAAATRLAEGQARTPFDLSRGPVLRATLLRLAPTRHRLCLTIHHIVCDGWSIDVLGRELSALYAAYRLDQSSTLPELPIQYRDFAQWQLRRQQGQAFDDAMHYWREQLTGAPATALPSDRPRPAVQNFRGAHLGFELSESVAARVSAIGHGAGATPFATLLAVFAVLLQSYSGTEDVVVGTPIAGRLRPESADLIGFFANTLVLRVRPTGEHTFAELVRAVGELTRNAVAHGDVPFEKLVEELQPDRDLARNPLFQVLFSYHEQEASAWRLPGCDVSALPGDSGTAKFDLSLSITRTAGACTGRLEYSTELFDAATAARIAEQFQHLLAEAVERPDRQIRHLPTMPDAERRRVLVAWNETAAKPPGTALLHEEFEARAARDPELPAVLADTVSGSSTLTYGELSQGAHRLADRLRALGAGPDTLVGIYLDRSPELMVALLGVLTAGAAYLPLDPSYPADRIAFMVADSGTQIVLTRRGLSVDLADLPVARIEVDNSDQLELIAAQVDTQSPTSPDNLAYVIYTSGSTGRPKGVMITHRNAIGFFAGMDAVFGRPSAPDPGTWLAVTSVSFDISVLELLWTMARGYRVVLRADPPSTTDAGAHSPAVPNSVRARNIEFSLFYFGGDDGGDAADRYRLLREGAKFADRNGFHAVWTPERHFHDFGGLYPNPALTSAALATITERVQLRAGSVVLPLHDPIRVAEEWSVLDNLTGGRVGVSVASGWHANDFVFAPDDYADRKAVMIRGVEQVRALWRGEALKRRGGTGAEVAVRVFPPPVQAELPIWITSARSPETFALAGELGAGLLTHLLGHSTGQLAEKIALYRQSWREHGHQGDGHVTLMMHTFVGSDTEAVRETVREPLCRYLKTSFDLIAGLGTTMGSGTDFHDLSEQELDSLVHEAFDRFFDTAGLLGTPETCADTVDRLKAIGVDEIACLIDFGVDHGSVLEALEPLTDVRALSEERRRVATLDVSFGEQLRRHQVTHLQCTPALAGLLAEDADSRTELHGLRELLVGGEALSDTLADELSGLVAGRVHNMYGPTEATVWATTEQLTGGSVGIGRPMSNVRAYVVDRWLRPVGIGVPGELLLGGSGIARGYWARPALTATRFIPDPFSGEAGARLYRTGDLVRWRASGELEFLGRLDHQVKIHGHRIELGEIENHLAAHPAVGTAVAMPTGVGAARGIVAYYVGVPGADPVDSVALQEFLRRSLPHYMLPSAIVELPKFPLTPNGKIDRRALPELSREQVPRREFRPPENKLEQSIAELWTELLSVDRVGSDDNFFEIGGNSLLAVQARSRLRDTLHRELSLVDVFRYPTPHTLAAALSGDGSGDAAIAAARAGAGRRRSALARSGGQRRGGRAS